MNIKPNGSLFIYWFLISFISKANGERIEGHAYINNISSFEDLEIGETSLPFQGLEKTGETGSCTNFVQRWTFMEGWGCYSFQWGGCDGNMNNFGTKEDCMRKCKIEEGGTTVDKHPSPNQYGRQENETDQFSLRGSMFWGSNRRRKCSCGKSKRGKRGKPNRIRGGTEAKKDEFPWMVRIIGGCVQRALNKPSDKDAGSCGGSLISPRLIVSAYHCSLDYHSPCDHSDGKRLAVLGRHSFKRRWVSSYYTIPIIDVKYPEYASWDLYYAKEHDFAIFILKTPAEFSDWISPICLPKQNEEFGGKRVVSAGWGQATPSRVSKRQSQVLRKVWLTVDYKKYKHYKMFGTKTVKKNGIFQDPCIGDSGGPLMYYNQQKSSYVLIGTVTGGGYDCTDDRTYRWENSTNGVWNKVSYWVDWIEKLITEIGETTCAGNVGK